MIKSIRVSNLGPFSGVQEISLPEGIVSIEGRYVNDSARSNRAGKTFFATDLLSFVLYGKHRFDTLEKMIHRNYDHKSGEQVGASVCLIDPAEEEFALSRFYDQISKRFTIDMPELGSREQVAAMKQKELQDSIDHVLGCDYQHACLTWMVRQNVVGARDLGDGAGGIMDLQASDRKQFLLDTFTPISLPWQAYYNEALLRLKTYQTRLSALESNLVTFTEKAMKINPVEIQLAITNKRAIRDESIERVTTLEAQLTALKEADVKTNIHKLSQQVQEASRKVAEINNSMSSLRRQIPTFEKLKKRSEESREQLGTVRERYTALEKKVNIEKAERLQQKYSEAMHVTHHLELELKSASDRLTVINQFKGKGSVCPVTAKACSSGMDIANMLVELNSQMSAKEKEFLAAEEAEQVVRKALSAQESINNEYASLGDSIQILQDTIDEGVDSEARISEITTSLAKQSEELRKLSVEKDTLQQQLDVVRSTSIQMHQQQIATVERRIIEAKREIADCDNEIIRLEGKMEYLKRLKLDIESVNQEIAEVTEDVQLYKTLSPALSKDGIPFFALVNSIAEFEYAVNKALQSLGSNLNITVQPYTELGTFDPVCHTCGFSFLSGQKTRCPVCDSVRQKKRKETLAIQFRGSSFNVDFTEDSGGGRLLVSLAIRLALFSVFKSRGMMDGIDFWVLDEVFSPLDTVGKTSMLQFMEDLGNDYGLKQIFVISHTDISDIIPPTIVIERNAVTESSTILG